MRLPFAPKQIGFSDHGLKTILFVCDEPIIKKLIQTH